MRRTILLYGLALAGAALVLQQIEYRIFVRSNAVEIYIALIALLFTVLGAWAGSRLVRTAPAAPFERNDRALASLGISPREYAVLELLAVGQSNKQIARSLSVSPNTVKTHVARLYEKLGVERRTQAVQQARALSLLP